MLFKASDNDDGKSEKIKQTHEDREPTDRDTLSSELCGLKPFFFFFVSRRKKIFTQPFCGKAFVIISHIGSLALQTRQIIFMCAHCADNFQHFFSRKNKQWFIPLLIVIFQLDRCNKFFIYNFHFCFVQFFSPWNALQI